MSPLQKLTRLKQIETALAAAALTREGRGTAHAFIKERDAILASVGLPPDELRNQVEPAPWAEAFAETFPSVAADQAHPWFEAAMSAAYDAGRGVGQTEGTQRAAELQRDGFKEMADVLQFIREAFPSSMRVRFSGPEGEFTGGERIERALKRAGVE